MFYRSGWLRCVVRISIGISGSVFVLTLGVSCWCYILYYILSYTILSSSFYSIPLSFPPSSSSQSPPLLPFPLPILFPSSHLPSILSQSFSPLLFPSQHSFYTCRYLHTLIYIVLFYSHLLLRYSSNPFPSSSSLSLLPNPLSLPNSFNTCRYLHNLIYIQR